MTDCCGKCKHCNTYICSCALHCKFVELDDVCADFETKGVSMTEEKKTCLKCKNQDCFIVYGVPQEKKKDCKEHHENFDWNIVFDCKNHNKFKE